MPSCRDPALEKSRAAGILSPVKFPDDPGHSEERKNPMAILLTGGTGFIGSHTAVELIKAGGDVVIVDDLSNSKEEIVDKIETITGRRPGV